MRPGGENVLRDGKVSEESPPMTHILAFGFRVRGKSVLYRTPRLGNMAKIVKRTAVLCILMATRIPTWKFQIRTAVATWRPMEGQALHEELVKTDTCKLREAK